MVFDLKAGISVGVVDLGEDRATVRQKIKMPYKEEVAEFMDIKEHLDYFGKENQVKAIYENDKLVAVEFYEGEVTFNEVDVFNTDVEIFFEQLEKLDADADVTEAEFTSKKGLLGTYDEEDGVVTSIMVCTPEYCVRPVKEYSIEEIQKWLHEGGGIDFLNQE